jgi:hypothetical protein
MVFDKYLSYQILIKIIKLYVNWNVKSGGSEGAEVQGEGLIEALGYT